MSDRVIEPGLCYADLVVIDDILPCDFSPVRTCEYEHYLSFYNSVLLSLEGWHGAVANETFTQALARLPMAPELKQRIVRFRDADSLVGRLAYVSFLHNAAALLPYFDERQMPFILQLYPGGGFQLDQPETDDQLRRIVASPLCRKVIVTQTISERYLLDRIGCAPEKVALIYGGVVENRVDFDFLKDKQLFGRDKQTLDLCFVAHRYKDNLSAKGYDHFIAVARALGADDPRLRFHVVGDYTAEDLPLGEIAGRVSFHGRQPSSFFRTFYPRMDAIISVNRPSSLAPGAFDGFPTGSCVEAGFRGVLNCINDPLGLNVAFTDQQDVVLLDDDADHSIATLTALLAEPGQLYELAYRNWRKFHEVFDMDRHLAARTRLITRELLRTETLVMRPPVRTSGLDGSNDSALAFWRDQVRSHAAALRDTDRRHLDLMAQHSDLQQRHDLLLREHQDLDERHAELTRRAAALEQQAAVAMKPGSGWRRGYQRLRTRLNQRPV